MTCVRSHRPQFLHLGLFVAAYVLGCGFAQSLAIVPGTGIAIWPPSGLFIATLVLASRHSWSWWILAACLAELFSNFLWFHSPLPAAFLIYTGNALEAMAGAWLVNRTLRRPVRLETLQEVLAFVALGAGVAPVISATVGSATLAWFGMQSQTFAAAWPLWWIGDATGVLIIAPLALVVLQNWRGKIQLSVARWIEACILGVIFLGVATLSLSGYLPFAYIIMPPLLWAAVRFEFRGAAVALALLAVITAVFTISGASQFAGDVESQKHNQIMLQLFLAISAFSALIVAAISRQHQLALLTLRQSVEALRDREGELSHLVDMVPSHVWRLTPDGEPTFFNKRMVDFLGMDIVDTNKPGMGRLEAVIETVHPDDAAEFRDALYRCLATGESFAMRYRLRRADGVYRWMSSRAEPMHDDGGRIVQWYGLCHDIDDQMYAEEALRRSERQLQEMIDAVPVRVWSATPAGGPVYFNKRYQDHFRSVIPNFEALEEPSIEELLQELIHPEDALEVQRTLRNSFETGGGSAMRFRWLEKDGAYRWAECRVEPRRDQDGSIVQWYGVSLDIDDEVRAQQALRDRERELSQLVDMVPVQIRRLTPEGEPTFFNKRLLDFFGLDDVAQLDKANMSRLSAAIQTLVHPEDKARLLDTVRHSLATGDPYSMKYRMRRADGAYRWVDGRGEPLRDQGGTIVQWFAISIDIDDEMRAQEALRERERELSQLVDVVPVAISRSTADGEPTFYNKRLIDFLGLDVADAHKPGMSRLAAALATVIHPDDAASLGETYSHSLLTGERFSMKYRLRRADGVYRWVEGRAEPLRDQSGAIVQWYAVTLDIDEEVRAQEALRERERELSQLVNLVPSLLWRLSPEGEPVFFSKRMIEFFGLNVGDYDKQGRSGLAAAIAALVHPDDTARLGEALNRSFATGERFSMKYRLRRADGAYRWMEGRAEPLRHEDGRILQWYGLSHDVDDQVHVEEALRERERFLWQLVETLPALIDCAAPDGEPIYRSQQLREFLGYNLEELDGAGKSRLVGTLDAGVHPDDVAGVKEQYAHSLSTGEPYSRKHRLRRFDGEYLWVDTRAAPMRNAEGAIIQWNVICLDIDSEVRTQEELRLAQERLARASQAASLAELSASIAHEVNQPLAAIVANSHACYRWLAAEPPNLVRAKTTAERIIRDANSAADVVSRIRALFRPSLEMRTSTPIPSVIAEARDLMAEEATRRRVRMKVDVEGELPPVALDHVQVQQVLINLIRNGMDAMGSVAGDRVLEIRVRRMGNEVQTEISDLGRGVEFPDKIFEPFFTTKEHGMGMGLAVCRSIVESHGGRLWAEKNEPHGATFIFTLPIKAKATP
ncbi:PAS domain-containing protein [Mesorhizobium sp. B2-1-8]|uniref:PAS domain-containing protein n=1 Tax=Mesorhizobium sp. B2-1-8 TaxID=2589967 RepID=UPI00112DEF5E|nr:PAS domain-containing protein [Mesorhizobium sp. B2-1-8]UCI19074.1 PAS domain-containing protein [Mesorhizobium sp. B2-1-8]